MPLGRNESNQKVTLALPESAREQVRKESKSAISCAVELPMTVWHRF